MRIFLSGSLFLLASFTVKAQTGQTEPCSPAVWIGHEEEIEAFLQTAEVLSVEKTDKGVTQPRAVQLSDGTEEHRAVFKPIRTGRQGGFWESYQAEVVAYELDKILGLGMVPPTIVRIIDRQTGSLQLVIENCRNYMEVKDQTPKQPAFSYELSRMRMFDSLAANPDRHGRNFLVGPEWEVVLIDHSRAFTSTKKLDEGPNQLPVFFDRALVERFKALNLDQLKEHFGDLLMGNQIEAILARRDSLMEHLEKLVSERGQSVFFGLQK